MDLKSLRLFTSLCRHLHFGRASVECHVSPSALSRAIQRLELELGQPLFERDNRTVSLTPAGQAYLEFARSSLQAWDELLERIQRQEPQLTGRLSIFATVTASQTFLPAVLQRFRMTYPGIHLQLETGYATDALQRLEEGVDVVVAVLELEAPPELEQRIIRSIPIQALAPATDGEVTRLLADGDVDWSRVPLVLPSTGPVRRLLDAWLRRQGLSPTIYSEVDGNEAALCLVALGCGVAFVPQLVVDTSPLRAEVRVLAQGPALPDIHVGFCTRRHRLRRSALIQALWQCI